MLLILLKLWWIVDLQICGFRFFTLLSFLDLCFNQSHYIEVAQGAIFMEQNMRFGLILAG